MDHYSLMRLSDGKSDSFSKREGVRNQAALERFSFRWFCPGGIGEGVRQVKKAGKHSR